MNTPGKESRPLEAIIVLGKHVINDKITVEYASRIHKLIVLLGHPGSNYEVVCFSGGTSPDSTVSEAEVGYRYFQSRVTGDIAKGRDVFLDDRSRSTRENIVNVVKHLQPRADRQALHLTILSSDYHILRLIETQRWIPRLSPLSLLEAQNIKWRMVSAPYPFSRSQDENQEWIGQTNLVRNKLYVLRLMLRYAEESERSRIPDLVACLVNDLPELPDLIARQPKSPYNCINRAAGALCEVRDALHDLLAATSASGVRSSESWREPAFRILAAYETLKREAYPDHILEARCE